VAEWLPIQVALPRFEISDPTTDDCCEAGTIWVNEVSGNVFISYADLSTDPPTCRWCQICPPESLLDVQEISVPLENITTPITPSPSYTIETPEQFITVVNTTTRNMICTVHFNSAQLNAVNTDAITQPVDLSMLVEFSQNGGGSWFTSGEWEITSHFDIAGTPGDFREFNTGSGHRVYTIGPGAPQTFGVRRSIRSQSGFSGTVVLDDLLFNTFCVAV
jgi:hypothetical protein